MTDASDNTPETQPSVMASLLSATGLTLLTTTCCALPITLVAIGAGGAMASLASSLPWLVTLGEYKVWTFSIAGVALGYSWWQVRRVTMCSVADAKRLRIQKWVLGGSTGLFAVSLFMAFALLPVTTWLEERAETRVEPEPAEQTATATATAVGDTESAPILSAGLESGEVVALSVTGLTCDGCVWQVKEAITKLPGVHDVVVNREADCAAVRFDAEGEVNSATLVSVIKELGYGASSLTANALVASADGSMTCTRL